jgi:hypothetical protein
VTVPDILSVVALKPYVVRVVFRDGEVRDVDSEPLLDGPVFQGLRNARRFGLVHIDEETGAVAWPGGADLDSDVIYGVARAAREPAARVTTPQPA